MVVLEAPNTGQEEISEEELGDITARPTDTAVLSKLFERFSAPLSGKKGASEMPRRLVHFVVDHTVCAPGAFDDDFEVTIGTLTTRQELEASRQSSGDMTTMAYLMAKSSLVAVNGVTIKRGKDEDTLLWNALGQGGRQLVMGMLNTATGLTEEVQGKAKASLKFSG